jgi:nucleoside-triphosphatase THEP1
MIILLAGPKGSGKSTVALNLAKRLSQAGIQVGGIICPGIFNQGRKIGIKSHSPNTGHEEIIGEEIFRKNSSITCKPVPEPTGLDSFSYGRWEFQKPALISADATVIRDLEAAQCIFVDEIGPLELSYGIGMTRTLAGIDAHRNNHNNIIVVCVRRDLAQTLTERWPESSLVDLAGDGPDALGKAEEAILATFNLLSVQLSSPGNAQPRDWSSVSSI